MRNKPIGIEELILKTIVSINGMEQYSEQIYFKCKDGSEYTMYHDQDCCERVQVEEVVGLVDDLIGTPILKASEDTDGEMPDRDYSDAHQWTFYNLATAKGYVTIRWLGESNGYYGMGVSFIKLKRIIQVSEAEPEGVK